MQISYWGSDYWIFSLLWYFYLFLHTLLVILVSHFEYICVIVYAIISALWAIPQVYEWNFHIKYIPKRKFQIGIIFEIFKYGAEMKAHIVMQMSWTVRPKWLIKYKEINKKARVWTPIGFNSLNPNTKFAQYGFHSILWTCTLKGY